MMIQKIGETPGRIWQVLDETGALRLSALKKRVDVPQAILYMALGWLAREDKLEIVADGRTYRVPLK